MPKVLFPSWLKWMYVFFFFQTAKDLHYFSCCTDYFPVILSFPCLSATFVRFFPLNLSLHVHSCHIRVCQHYLFAYIILLSTSLVAYQGHSKHSLAVFSPAICLFLGSSTKKRIILSVFSSSAFSQAKPPAVLILPYSIFDSVASCNLSLLMHLSLQLKHFNQSYLICTSLSPRIPSACTLANAKYFFSKFDCFFRLVLCNVSPIFKWALLRKQTSCNL